LRRRKKIAPARGKSWGYLKQQNVIYESKVQDVSLISSRFSSFFKGYEDHFRSTTRSVARTAEYYTRGLMTTRRRNCQAMAMELGEVNDQQLHHLLTQAKWEARPLMDRVTLDFKQLIEDHGLSDDMALLLDESSFPKKGRHSAGVSRQYCGQRGKVDNCQVGVFGALNAGSLVNLIQAKLYHPGAAVSKIDHAWAIIHHVTQEMKIGVHWIGFDAFYGRDTALLGGLVKIRQEFVADVPDTHQVWLKPFQMRVPRRKGMPGRQPIHAQPTETAISIREYSRTLGRKDWRTIQVRHQSKGKLKAKFHRRDIYILNPLTGRRQKLILLIRKDRDGTIKYSLCHAPKYIRIRVLAYRQCKRYFIEQSFREAKMELGLNEYQTRSEEGWLRHMTMCMLTQLFINSEKLRQRAHHKLRLSTGEILKFIQFKSVIYENPTERLFQLIIRKQPFRMRSRENLLFLRI
jgi:SRSO17 transposase